MKRRKSMKERVLSVVLCMAMIFTYVPMSVSAEESQSETQTTNVASVTTAGTEQQSGETTEYSTLADAVTAANASAGSTITLLKEVDSEGIDFSGSDITLDLNGKKLNLISDSIYVRENASLTIKDSGNGGEIYCSVDGVTIWNYGNLILESGTVSNEYNVSGSASEGIVNSSSGTGTITVNGGTIKAIDYPIDLREGKVTINGGEISGDVGVFVGGGGGTSTSEIIINAGIICGTRIGISCRYTKCTINGGYITGDDEAIYNSVASKVIINGGVYRGDKIVYDSEGDLVVEYGEGVALYDSNNKEVNYNDATAYAYAINMKDYVALIVTDDGVVGYNTLKEAVVAAGTYNMPNIEVIKSTNCTEDINISVGQTLIISNGVNLTLSDTATLNNKANCTIMNYGTIRASVVNEGDFYNYGTVIGAIVNNDSFYNYGTIDGITNKGVFTSYDNSVIKGEIKVEGTSAEDTKVSLAGCSLPNGLTVSGSIGQDSVTIADVIAEGYCLYNDKGEAVVLTEDMTSIEGPVVIDAKRAVKLTDGYGNETLYEDLQEAMDSSTSYEEATVTLLDDITVNEEIAIEVESDIILDLNGKKITYVPLEEDYDYEVLDVYVYSNGKFTIKSSATGGSIDGSQTEYALYVGGSGSAVIESGTFIGGYTGIENDANLVVNGGVVKGTYGAIDNYDILTVNDGTFEATGVSTEDEVCVTLYNCGSVTISGGTFNNASTIWNDIEYSESVSATVLGGTYPNGFGVIGGQTIADVLPSNSALYKVTDDEKVALTEGQTSIAEAVYAKATEVVSVTTKNGEEKKFFDLQSAFDYAYDNDGSTVKLLCDVSSRDTVTVGDMSGMVYPGMSGDMVDITLDLNGKTWTSTGEHETMIVLATELTVKSSVEGGAIDASKAFAAINVMLMGALVVESGTYIGYYHGIYNMDGTLIVDGGTIKGGYDAIYNDGMATINGGTLEVTDTESAEAVTVYNAGQLVITGGTLKNASTIYNDITESELASVAIVGGTYPNGLSVIGGNTLADVLASNASIYDSEDEKVTLTENQISIQGSVYVEASKVASVTTKDGAVKDFVVLQSAFDYACDNAGSTIKLLDDITTGAMVISGSMDLLMGSTDIATFTLDLNGKTWEYTGSLGAIAIGLATLTIKSSAPGGKIVASNAMGAVLIEMGMLMVESGTIVGGQMGIGNGGELFINGGTVIGDVAVDNQGFAYVSGGIVTGTTAAIINEQEVAVSGGTLTYSATEDGAVIINYGTVTIEGGTLDGAVTIANYQESEEDSAPIVNIAGGEYPQGFAIDSQNAISAITVKEALAKGCSFVDADGNTVTLTDDQTSITGAVSVDFAKNVSVTTKDGVVTYYAYLSGALAEAAKNPGSTVTLLADITTNMLGFAMGGEFTIDLNGKKYTLAEDSMANVAIALLNSDVTIKSSVEGGTIDASAVYGQGIASMNGTLTIESGTIIGLNAITNQGTLVIKDGTFKGVVSPVYNVGTATIDGGTFEYIDEELGGVFNNAGKLVINGGTFKGNHLIGLGPVIGPGIGPMMSEAVIAGGYFPNGIIVNSYDGTDEESLLKNILAEGCGFYTADGTVVTLEDDQRAIDEAVVAGVVEFNSNTYPTEFGYTGEAVADPEDYITAAGEITFAWFDAEGEELETAPSAVGTYTLKVYTELADGTEVELATQTVTIKYLEVESGVQYTTDDADKKEFFVTATEGYVLVKAEDYEGAESMSDVIWADKLTITKAESATCKFYVKEVATGYISDVVTEEYTYVNVIYGDASGDGKVDVTDGVVLKKYLAGYKDTGIVLDNCDVNVDNEINVADAVLLMKYLANYTDVVLGQAQGN